MYRYIKLQITLRLNINTDCNMSQANITCTCTLAYSFATGRGSHMVGVNVPVPETWCRGSLPWLYGRRSGGCPCWGSGVMHKLLPLSSIQYSEAEGKLKRITYNLYLWLVRFIYLCMSVPQD